MNAVAKVTKVQEQPAQVVAMGAAPLMEVISRAAADPNTDVDKLERLLGMYERITAQQAKAAFTSALAQMQPELPIIQERGEAANKITYARWEDINEAIRPLLHAHGFALNFRIGRVDGTVAVTGILSHADGHSEETTLDLPVDTGPGRNAVQSVGSSVSYGKRYTAIALLNITSRHRQDRDDDGNAAGGLISAEQVRTLDALIKGADADRAAFLKYLGVSDLADLPATKFKAALNALQAKKRQAAQKAGAR